MTKTPTPSIPRRTTWARRSAPPVPPAAMAAPPRVRYAAVLAQLITDEAAPVYRDLLRLHGLKARYTPWKG